MKSELWQQKTWGKTPDYTFEDVMVEYLKAKKTTSSYRNILYSTEVLRQHFGGMAIKDITKAYLNRAIAALSTETNVRNGTLRSHFAYFKAAISYCRRQLDFDIPSILEGVRLPAGEKRVRWIDKKEAGALIAAAESQPKSGNRLSCFIRLALNTGMRKNEMLKLRWSSIDLGHRLVTLLADENKSGRTRSVPLNDAAVHALNERFKHNRMHCPESPWVFALETGERWKYPTASFRKACEKAGIENFRIHDLRHTCASWLVSAGVPIADVKEVLGHASVTMTERYAHLAPHRAMSAVSMLCESQSGHTDNVFAISLSSK